MILIAHSQGVETTIQFKCGDSAAEIAGVLNKVCRKLHPEKQFDDAPFHAAMKAVAEEYDARKREKRKREHA